MNKEEKLRKLKYNLENLLFNLESKKDELYTYLKESELQINTIKNQLDILNNHLYEEQESIQNKRKEDHSLLHSVRSLDRTKSEEYKDNEEYDEEDGESEEDDESEEDNIEDRIMANIDPNLARLLGIEVKEETKSDWVPPSFSGLHNSSRNSTYDHLYKK